MADGDSLPGYRRRFLVTPAPGQVRADLEDDWHCMSVIVHHADGVATRIEAIMHRAPWTTCPGAEAVLAATFKGVPLDGFVARGERQQNCTHLHDLAMLAAAHAGDEAPTQFDILASDPIDGEVRSELRRNGDTVLAWTLKDGAIVAPELYAGRTPFQLGPVIAALDREPQAHARLLRWGTIMAHGRTIPLAEQSDATRIPPNCFTFQAERAARAKRIGLIRDFNDGDAHPLDGGTGSIAINERV